MRQRQHSSSIAAQLAAAAAAAAPSTAQMQPHRCSSPAPAASPTAAAARQHRLHSCSGAISSVTTAASVRQQYTPLLQQHSCSGVLCCMNTARCRLYSSPTPSFPRLSPAQACHISASAPRPLPLHSRCVYNETEGGRSRERKRERERERERERGTETRSCDTLRAVADHIPVREPEQNWPHRVALAAVCLRCERGDPAVCYITSPMPDRFEYCAYLGCRRLSCNK